MMIKELELSPLLSYLKKRPSDSHKGRFGHVLIVGGDVGYSGAVRLSAAAALRTGAGLVSVATHPRHADSLNSTFPEIMSHAVNTEQDLVPLLKKATVVVFGPGLGTGPWGRMLFSQLESIQQPLLVDADGLNLLAEHPFKKTTWVLTPHPGEAARLLKQTAQVVQRDRTLAVQHLQQQYGGVAVLKGAGTLVADAQMIYHCSQGNPGMATAGMGDVLSGVIGSLLAQSIPLADAAKLGVLLHAMAGDLAAKAGERGTIASDLLPMLRKLVNHDD